MVEVGLIDESELYSTLKLYRLLHDKPLALASLLDHFGCAQSVLAANSWSEVHLDGVTLAVIKRLEQKNQRTLDSLIEADLAWLEQPDQNVLILGKPGYPALLSQINDPPLLLFCRGNLEYLQSFKIAMVGSRNPTRSGVNTAELFSKEIASAGISVVSGLALGIDAAAHRGALAACEGSTIAVLGTGCDMAYPARNKILAERIANNGLLLSEFPLASETYPSNFPRRNRIVTGLSLGTLIVEAQPRSGSLISARLAMEQGREVFAVPGSIHSRQSRGCHQLIRDGVTLVENVTQILQELGSLAAFELEHQQQKAPMPVSEFMQQILDQMSAEPILLDQLVEKLDVAVPEILAALLELEVDGHISSDNRGYCLL